MRTIESIRATSCLERLPDGSCSDPNLQQVPRDPFIRGICGCASGLVELVVADYSQVELRIAAMMANETTMSVSSPVAKTSTCSEPCA